MISDTAEKKENEVGYAIDQLIHWVETSIPEYDRQKNAVDQALTKKSELEKQINNAENKINSLSIQIYNLEVKRDSINIPDDEELAQAAIEMRNMIQAQINSKRAEQSRIEAERRRLQTELANGPMKILDNAKTICNKRSQGLQGVAEELSKHATALQETVQKFSAIASLRFGAQEAQKQMQASQQDLQRVQTNIPKSREYSQKFRALSDSISEGGKGERELER